MSKFIDLTGQQIKQWKVLRRDCENKERWICECKCGQIKPVWGCHLRKNKTVSCRQCSEKKDKGKLNSKLWGIIVRNAKSRNIEFNITKEYARELLLKQDKKCALTNLPIDISTTCYDNFHKNTTASLDRIDSDKGYVEGNVQWVHKHLNVMKNSHSMNYFINLCRLVAEHHKNWGIL